MLSTFDYGNTFLSQMRLKAAYMHDINFYNLVPTKHCINIYYLQTKRN